MQAALVTLALALALALTLALALALALALHLDQVVCKRRGADDSLAVLGPLDCFGESALADDAAQAIRKADVVGYGDATVLRATHLPSLALALILALSLTLAPTLTRCSSYTPPSSAVSSAAV